MKSLTENIINYLNELGVKAQRMGRFRIWSIIIFTLLTFIFVKNVLSKYGFLNPPIQQIAQSELTPKGKNYSIDLDYAGNLCAQPIIKYFGEEHNTAFGDDFAVRIRLRSEYKSRVFLDNFTWLDEYGNLHRRSALCDVMADGVLLNVILKNKPSDTSGKVISNKVDLYLLTQEFRKHHELPPAPKPTWWSSDITRQYEASN